MIAALMTNAVVPMQEGSLRCDVNVSVRPQGQAQLGTKVEVKNMNSFSAMQRAIDFEIARQTKLLQSGDGGSIVQETRLFDEAKQVCSKFGFAASPNPHGARTQSKRFDSCCEHLNAFMRMSQYMSVWSALAV